MQRTPALSIVPEYKPTQADLTLEHKLTMLINAQLYAESKPEQRKLCAEHTQLHATRSPGMVLYLESKLGLST